MMPFAQLLVPLAAVPLCLGEAQAACAHTDRSHWNVTAEEPASFVLTPQQQKRICFRSTCQALACCALASMYISLPELK